jgi:hypothetical protein
VLVKLSERLQKPPFLEPGGRVCEFEVPARVILAVEETGVPFAYNLEVTFRETLRALVFIYKIFGLIVII